MTEEIKAVAVDGTEFTAESPEVVAYLEQYPDVTLEAALGSVVMVYNRSKEESVSEEVTE